jgi:uncharacterized protein YjbJ (UPF0337 family)
MSNHRPRGDWRRVKGRIRGTWGELTDDDVDIVAGRRAQLAGPLRKRHGVAREELEEQMGELEDRDTRV